MSRLLLRPLLGPGDVHLSDRYGFRYLAPSGWEPIAFHLLVNGCYEPEAVEWVLGQLGPSDMLVDVGANIGVFAMPASERVGPDGKVLAVEASPAVFRYLERNVAMNGLSNVLLCGCAASERDWPRTAFYEAPADHFGMGSLAPQFGATPIHVPARTLDSVLAAAGVKRVDVLKVDAEGFEAAVFAGARRLLSTPAPPAVLFEFCDWAEARAGREVGDAQRMLLSLGYDIFRLTRFGRLRRLREVAVAGAATLVALPA